jgi:AcrR family transcriptional regulator
MRFGSKAQSPLKQGRRLPVQLRSRATVAAIFEAAIQVLERTETTDPSVHTIADRAGVSVGSLYQYFPSKAALVQSLLGFHLGQRMRELELALDSMRGLSGEEAAARLVDNLIGEKTTRMRVEHAMIRLFCRVGELATLTEFDGQMNALVERFLVSLEGQIRPVDTRIAAFLISNLLRSAVLLTIVQEPARLHDPVFKTELVRMVVGYLRT